MPNNMSKNTARVETRGAAETLITTPPSLQAPAPTSMAVVWGVNMPATGFVEISRTLDFNDPELFHAGRGGLRALDDTTLIVRLAGLSPNTRYFYRIATIPVTIPNRYKPIPGETLFGETHSFQTPGVAADSTFCVINDTHEAHDAFRTLACKIEELSPAVTVWNGDLCSHMDNIPQMFSFLLNPGETAFATDRPFVYVPGNHDYRGWQARSLHRFIATRPAGERDSRYAELERNFAVRQGDIALIGLDTGEDKADWREEWGGLAQFSAYREQQAEWLADALEQPGIKDAPFIVALCHIPLFDDRPQANPGDIATHYASWQRQSHDLWSPLFNKYGVQLVISGHAHKFRYHPSDNDRCWAQLVGGAGFLREEGDQLAIIHGRVKNEQLIITVHNLADESIPGEFAFGPR